MRRRPAPMQYTSARLHVGMPSRSSQRADVPTCQRVWSLNDPSHSHPSRNPPSPVGVQPIETRQLHAAARAMDECLFPDVHPDVGDAATGLRREQQDVASPQRVDDRSHLASRVRLIATHPRYTDAMLAVCPLHQARAVEPIFRGPAPDVWCAERVERGLHDTRGTACDVAYDHEWRSRRWRGAFLPGRWPAAIHRLPNRHRESDRGGDPIAGVRRGAPEAAWPDVLHPVYRLQTERRPRNRTPLDSPAKGPKRRQLLRRCIRGDTHRNTGEGVGAELRAAPKRVQLPARTVERVVATEIVVDQHLDRESVREDPGDGSVGPKLVALGLIARIPAPVPHIDVTPPPLGGELGDSGD